MITKPAIHVILGLVTACVALAAAPANAGEQTRPRAVLELFTSQGCGRCPPADALLDKLGREPDLVTLSYAVDYWDYLGWKDTAAKPEFTQRQRAYGERRGDRAVYTPQIVVDGRVHVVGSDREAIETAVGELARSGGAPSVAVDMETSGEALVVKIGDAPAGMVNPRATVWLARYERSRTVPIGKGENSGKTVTYTRLVRSLQPVGMWKGKGMAIELPRRETTDAGDGCAILLQVDDETGPGPILGARIWEAAGS